MTEKDSNLLEKNVKAEEPAIEKDEKAKGALYTKTTLGHPLGLMLLFVTEMAERFSYYGMRSLFKLYLISALFENSSANGIYGAFTGLVYLTPMLGGWVSDKFWGNRKCIIVGSVLMALGQFLLFFSSMFAKKAVKVANGPVDPSVDNTQSIVLLGIGVVFLIFGNGFFKPNISTMVGDLYEPTDERKDSAYTIFYMGINLGALFAPFICGAFAPKENGYLNPSGFKWGFFAAGVGMLFSLCVFMLLKNKLIVTPEGVPIGLPPKQDTIKAKRIEENRLLEKALKEESGETEEKEQKKNNNLLRGGISAVAGVSVALIYYFFLNDLPVSPSAMDYIVEIINAIIFGCFIGLPIFIIMDRNINKSERSRINVIYIIAAFAVCFWSSYEQAASSLTDVAEFASNKQIGSWTFPTAWLQSVNPFFIVILAPVFAALWEFLNKHNKEPSSLSKQAIGLAILAISYLVISLGYSGFDFEGGEKKNILWLIVLYFVQTLGELCLSPIGNSLVYKLAPPHLSSLLMGVWLMSSSISNVFAGKLANFAPSAAKKGENGKLIYKSVFGITFDTFSKFFNVFIVISGVAGVILFALVPILKRMMKGIK
ncbi:di-tripeptide ABC transporter [Anaeromyces robustus]|uniref:Di-tripeptide ABC transporter n=1 Tax=Anaeromyces robustus TaxID=1754192 RepID=A0A1Y1WTW0_9FUNG|nr:di-tripeptide ABC transporter [Anaeromyces robustus]|eukprot:ORX76748.1 di-tripeptide ABC transporter [Anaeromyces robustus]